MNENNLEPPIKIAIMGMDNAGKSTIVKFLLENEARCPSEAPQMTATKGVIKEPLTLFEKTTVVWDFGGQEIYRNKYLKEPSKYFRSIDFFFYVVDVLDYVRMFSAAMYFKGVFQLIRKYSPNAKLIFLFHKADPGFKPSENDVKAEFMNDIKPFIKPSKVKYTLYNTSIFDLENLRKLFENEICK
ncbi:MAG: ADP-ribosylation factor-like protein [Promethearchaeota archaeon]